MLTDPVPLTDDRRHGVPVTLVCPEYRADDVRDWLADGHLPELDLRPWALTDPPGWVGIDLDELSGRRIVQILT